MSVDLTLDFHRKIQNLISGAWCVRWCAWKAETFLRLGRQARLGTILAELIVVRHTPADANPRIEIGILGSDVSRSILIGFSYL